MSMSRNISVVEPRQPALGVAHRGRRVVVERAEVALAVDERVAQRERLRHADEGVVDRLIAMRVVVPHHLTDHAADFRWGRFGCIPALFMRTEDATMHGLEPVPDVRERRE